MVLTFPSADVRDRADTTGTKPIPQEPSRVLVKSLGGVLNAVVLKSSRRNCWTFRGHVVKEAKVVSAPGRVHQEGLNASSNEAASVNSRAASTGLRCLRIWALPSSHTMPSGCVPLGTETKRSPERCPATVDEHVVAGYLTNEP
jgi:hypothetical protein